MRCQLDCRQFLISSPFLYSRNFFPQHALLDKVKVPRFTYSKVAGRSAPKIKRNSYGKLMENTQQAVAPKRSFENVQSKKDLYGLVPPYDEEGGKAEKGARSC